MPRSMRVLTILLFILVAFSTRLPAQDTLANFYLKKEKSFHLHNIDSVSYYGIKAVQEAQKGGQPKVQIEAMHELAFNYRENAQYDDALKLCLDAREIALKLGDSLMIGNNSYLLGSLYFEKDNFEASEKHYLIAIRVFEQHKMFDYMAYAQNGVANLYSFFKKNDKATEYYTRAIKTASLSSNKRLPGTINNNLGNFYIKQNDYARAEEYLKRAEKIFEENKFYHDLAPVYFNMGFINIAKKNYDFAIHQFKKCASLGRQYKLFEDQRDAYKELEKVYKLMGNYEQAYYYSDSFRVLTEKVTRENLERKIAEMEVKLQVHEKNNEILAQQKKIEKHTEQHKEENTVISMLIGFLAALIAFSIALMYFVKKNRAKNAFLERQHQEIMRSKEKIDKALAEKEMLLKEVHHRVKNNLQIISSLLNLQASSSDNEKVSEELQYAKDRIHAISLVHKKLYASADMSRISSEEYITELLDQQKRAFLGNKSLTAKVNTNKCNFNLNTSVPLGIIINELMTNSFKHAFSTRENCLLQIELSKLADDKYKLLVSDNGPGYPENFDINTLTSLGMEIISSVTEQLNGTVRCYNEGGACTEIIFTEI
jgi:two-component system, sensor histidine kinase PdtaS